jgi:hypothetical protein
MLSTKNADRKRKTTTAEMIMAILSTGTSSRKQFFPSTPQTTSKSQWIHPNGRRATISILVDVPLLSSRHTTHVVLLLA